MGGAEIGTLRPDAPATSEISTNEIEKFGKGTKGTKGTGKIGHGKAGKKGEKAITFEGKNKVQKTNKKMGNSGINLGKADKGKDPKGSKSVKGRSEFDRRLKEIEY